MLDFDLRDYSFECAAGLPEQFFADRHQFGEPIKRLMFAVLNDAICCYQTNVEVRRPHAQRLLAEAKSGCSVCQVKPPSHLRAYAKSYKSMRCGYGAHFYDGLTRN